MFLPQKVVPFRKEKVNMDSGVIPLQDIFMIRIYGK